MISHYVIDFGNVTYMSNITRWCNVTPINNIEKTTLANYVILRILVCACTVYWNIYINILKINVIWAYFLTRFEHLDTTEHISVGFGTVQQYIMPNKFQAHIWYSQSIISSPSPGPSQSQKMLTFCGTCKNWPSMTISNSDVLKLIGPWEISI